MTSAHTPPLAGTFAGSVAWNTAQAKLMERLSDIGEGTLDAYLVASVTYQNSRFLANISGLAHRNIATTHPAYPILAKAQTGYGPTPEAAMIAALKSY